MGRKLRMVPKGWQHPKNDNGHYQPMFDEYYGDAIAEWIEKHNEWLRGENEDQKGEGGKYKFYAQWDGNAPNIDYYRTEKWDDSEATCFQVYENVSEGTPVSPVFEDKGSLVTWLTTQGYSLHAATQFAETGWAPSMIMMGGVMKTGIDSLDLL